MNAFTITQGDEKLFRLYNEYNPEKDFSGSVGIEIADIIYRRFNGDFTKMRVWYSMMKMRKSSLEKQALLTRNK